MVNTALIVSLVLTAFVLILSLVTISKGYAYKHTIDPLEKDVDESESETKK